MRKIVLLFGVLFFILGCKNSTYNQKVVTLVANEIEHAKNFELYSYPNFKILKITKPWQQANEPISYILAKDKSLVPDSLQQQPFIQVPVQRTIATSTTHIPSYNTLNEIKSLIGFPNLNYISSPEVREYIKAGKIVDVGDNESLNTELIIDLSPDLIIGYGMESSNKTLEQFKKIGIPIIYNADWTEQTPLGKAEWIKFFGALFNKSELANSNFDSISKQYTDLKKLAKKAKSKPQVFSGSLYQDTWYAPQGTSWGALFLEDANADYIWKHTKGDGSIAISIEQALLDAKHVPIWLNPGSFENLADVAKNSKHNLQFNAAKSGEIYTIANKKGETGGVIYYELAPNRPDLVLKDLIKILHPDLLPNYELYFYEKLH